MYLKKRSKQTQTSSAKPGFEVSAGAVPFYIENKTIKVLILIPNNVSGDEWFDMPKGHVEKGESLVRAAQREIGEEIGLSLHLDTNFREDIDYFYTLGDPKTGGNERISKKATYFLALMHRKDTKQITLSPEHKRYYLLPIDEAIEKAKFENQKVLLEKAKDYITRHYLT